MNYIDLLARRIEERSAERDAIVAELDELLVAPTDEARNLTTDEDERAKALLDQIKSIDADIDADEARKAELEAVKLARTKAHRPIVQHDAPQGGDVHRLSRPEARDAALRKLDERHDFDVAPEGLAKVERLVRTKSANCDGDEIARRLLLTENDAYRSGWAKAVSQSTPIFTSEEAAALSEFRAMSTTTTAGGFAIPVLIDPSVIITSTSAAAAPLLAVSRVETITNNVWKGVSAGATAWSFDAEAAAVSDDTSTFAQPSVTAHMARGFIPYSIEIEGDYPSFATEMAMLLEVGYIDLLALKTATGSGTNEPFGIFTAIDATAGSEVAVTTDGSFGAVDIDAVWASLPERWRRRASWFMNVDVENEIRGFGSGTATSRFTVDQTQEGISLLNGKPVLLSDDAPTFTGTTGAANILIVGDFSNYLVAQRAGMTIERVEHLFDVTNNRPTGERGWFAWSRIGADSVNDAAFRLLQNT